MYEKANDCTKWIQPEKKGFTGSCKMGHEGVWNLPE